MTTENDVDLDKLVDRVRKLLANAGNNPNEHEAAVAMEIASRLIAQHNLDADKIKGTDNKDERVRESYNSNTMRQKWARYVWYGVADLNFCMYWYEHRSHQPDKHCLIGTPANVVATKVMSEYLVEAVERLAQDSSISGHERPAFKLGCATRLQARLIALKKDRAKGEGPTTTSTTLPALLDLYTAHKAANEEAYKDAFGAGKLRKGESVKTSRDDGFAKGYAAGNTISLNIQVDGNKRQALK